MGHPIWLTPAVQIDSDIQLAGFLAPQLRIEFRELNSLNDYLGTARHFGSAEGMIKKWRKAGEKQALFQAGRQGFKILNWTTYEPGRSLNNVKAVTHSKFEQPCFKLCELVVRYWRPSWHRYDVFSPFIKPVIDGFVDAGMFEDDDQTRIRKSSVEFMGIDPTLKLSDEAKAGRKIKRMGRKKSLLTPSRFWLDFYETQV